jgi:hypothetical protein
MLLFGLQTKRKRKRKARSMTSKEAEASDPCKDHTWITTPFAVAVRFVPRMIIPAHNKAYLQCFLEVHIRGRNAEHAYLTQKRTRQRPCVSLCPSEISSFFNSQPCGLRDNHKVSNLLFITYSSTKETRQ